MHEGESLTKEAKSFQILFLTGYPLIVLFLLQSLYEEDIADSLNDSQQSLLCSTASKCDVNAGEYRSATQGTLQVLPVNLISLVILP